MSNAWTDKYQNGKGGWFQYFFNIGLAYSQLLSAFLGGDPDESVSSRCGRAERAGKPLFVLVICPFLDMLLGEEDHCLISIEDDEPRNKEIWDWAK